MLHVAPAVPHRVDVLARLKPYVDAVDRAVLVALDDLEPVELREAALHYPRAGGKRLRPAMALLACEAAGGRRDDALAFAAAVELVHDFSLVHDDIMDRDLVRRGMPTVHAKWGEPVAILAGDALLAKAFEAVASGAGSAAARLHALRDLATSTRALCEGQALDMAFEARDDVAPGEYLHMIAGKTGRLFEVACRGGAYYADGGDAVVAPLEAFGKAFGQAFQVHDDLLDLAPAARTGKPFGSDLRAGKKTLIVLEARRRGLPEEVARVLGRRDAAEADVKAAADALARSGAVRAAEEVVEKATERATAALGKLPPSPARETLREMASWAATRTS